MGWQAIDERGYWDGLTNGNVVARAAGVICPMAGMLLADGTDASPDTTSRRLPSFHTARGGRGHRVMPW
jgi:hypothetical protein